MSVRTKDIPLELPLIPIRNRVIFPGSVVRLNIGRAKSLKIVEHINRGLKRTRGGGFSNDGSGNGGEDAAGAAGGAGAGANAKSVLSPKDNVFVALATIRSPPPSSSEEENKDGPSSSSSAAGPPIYPVGVVVRVAQMSRAGKELWTMLVEGVIRFEVSEFTQANPFWRVRISLFSRSNLRNDASEEKEVRALSHSIAECAKELLALLKPRGSKLNLKTKEYLERVARLPPDQRVDVLTALVDASVAEKQQVLEARTLLKRLKHSLPLIRRQIEVLKMSNQIQNKVEGNISKSQREFYLRQQLKAIQEELAKSRGKGGAVGGDGDEDEGPDELEELVARLDGVDLPPDARRTVTREIKRIKRMNAMQPEYSVLLTYLEWIADLPWGEAKSTDDRLDIDAVRAQLDADHFGLDKVKKRIVEYIAVRSIRRAQGRDIAGPILCLVGPPGVGKTSLGRSVATSLGRSFQRMSLGGVHDESEIRGHRRTYIGSMPGQLMHCLKKAGTNNPVILLDEIDKLGRDHRGDPSSALLEVLDGEQNHSFMDHYINTPFDLSKVLFIATANYEDQIPGPLLDRMEVIRLPGYTDEEKLHIAKSHLIPKQLDRHGISPSHVIFPDPSIHAIAARYTREAGVRALEQKLAGVCRHVALSVARDRKWEFEREKVEASEAVAAAEERKERGKKEGERRAAREEEEEEEEGEIHLSVGEEEGEEREGVRAASLAPLPSSSEEGETVEHTPLVDVEEGSTLQATATQEDKSRNKNEAADAAGGPSSAPPSADAAAAAAVASGDSGDREEEGGLSPGFEGIVVTEEVITDVLGPTAFEPLSDARERRMTVPGVVMGLAWTPFGGEVLFIEGTLMAGTGRLTLTGKLGDVMKESAQTALSWIRANSVMLRLSKKLQDRPLKNADVHIHFPAGAIPKDGPSAGCAITSMLFSLLSGRQCRADTAVTGEVTLRGTVLPVGGIKEKLIAAFRAGCTRVCIPARNEKDLAELPKTVRAGLEVFPCDRVEQVLDNIIEGGFEPLTNAPAFTDSEMVTELLTSHL